MSRGEKELRRLVIKSYHIHDIEYGDENRVSTEGKLVIDSNAERFLTNREEIASIRVKVIHPGEWNVFTNSMMDIIPIR